MHYVVEKRRSIKQDVTPRQDMSAPAIGLVDAHSESLDSFIQPLVVHLPVVLPQRKADGDPLHRSFYYQAARIPGGWHEHEKLSIVAVGLVNTRRSLSRRQHPCGAVRSCIAALSHANLILRAH